MDMVFFISPPLVIHFLSIFYVSVDCAINMIVLHYPLHPCLVLYFYA
jgi:hypothetical protein